MISPWWWWWLLWWWWWWWIWHRLSIAGYFAVRGSTSNPPYPFWAGSPSPILFKSSLHTQSAASQRLILAQAFGRCWLLHCSQELHNLTCANMHLTPPACEILISVAMLQILVVKARRFWFVLDIAVNVREYLLESWGRLKMLRCFGDVSCQFLLWSQKTFRGNFILQSCRPKTWGFSNHTQNNLDFLTRDFSLDPSLGSKLLVRRTLLSKKQLALQFSMTLIPLLRAFRSDLFRKEVKRLGGGGVDKRSRGAQTCVLACKGGDLTRRSLRERVNNSRHCSKLNNIAPGEQYYRTICSEWFYEIGGGGGGNYGKLRNY